ncbi:hypothetical protein VTJ49DRAFT_3299 [Mycothermus thermophilus]|uniref:Kelch repeat protein n=1 Tax=Humicola insolens TaxID=85995 RepID=A0ABR3V9T3_HUMIN
MPSSRGLSRLLALLSGLGSVGARLVDVPSVENFYRRSAASVTVIGDYLYIDGGEISQAADGKRPAEQRYASNVVNSTISIDLSKSWTTSDVILRTIEKPWFSKIMQVIWTDREEGVFYVWAGRWLRGRNMTDNEYWKFTPDGSGGGSWNLETPANPDVFNNLHPADHIVFANSNDTGFALGGIASGWSERGRGSNAIIPGMVTFDMRSKTWRNHTTAESPFETIASSPAHYIDVFGPNGLIMAFGGVAHPVSGSVDWANAPSYDLGNLTFFDPKTVETYWQTATGDIPESPRTQFCIAGFRNPEGGYEIVLTGGHNHRDEITYSDTYVLSLPGFVWTKAPNSGMGGRRSPACAAIGRRQMLVVGGTTRKGWDDKDPAPQGLLLFDVAKMEWKDTYDPEAEEYERPAVLKTFYSNGSFEAVNWSSEKVRELFGGVKKSASSPTDTNSTSSDPDSNPEQTSSGTSTAVIIGAVLGSVAAVVLSLLAWYLIRRRRRSKAASTKDHSDGKSTLAGGSEAPEVVPLNGGSEGYYAAGDGWYKPPVELTAVREHAELGGNEGYGEGSQVMRPVEMDAGDVPASWPGPGRNDAAR